MRKKKQQEVTPEKDDKILDVHAGMQGTLRFEDPVNLRINGKFEGTLDTKGFLMLGKNANIKANITGESVSIAGNVNGNIKATKNLKLESTAVLIGDVESPKLAIEDGAILNGRITMDGTVREGDSSRGDWLSIDQLAKYLEVDLNKINEWADNGMLPGTKEAGEWVFDKSKVDQWISEGKVKV